ncbi:MAG: insulinase family protein [Caedimonas sp.]|nr:insulinase family protein [Caedimonas sp.]
MRTFFIRLTLWGPLFCVLSCFLSPASQGALKIQEVISSHGIKAWLVEDHTIPVMSIRLSFKAGSAYVPVEKAGLVDVLSHMLDEGAGPYSAREFNERLQKLAIGLSFGCDLDEFKVFLKTTTEHRREAFELLKLALTQPRFGATEFEKVRSASIAALKAQKKMPDYLAEKAFHETFMANHPYALPISGTEETLQGLTPHDLEAFIKKAFVKETLTIGVCGDITPQDLRMILDDLFKELPDKSALPPIPSLAYPRQGETKVIQANFPQSQSVFAQRGLNPRDPDYVLMVILNQILGASPSSRLFSTVRVKKGNAYSISTSIENYDQASILSGELGSANHRVLPSLDLVQKIWREVKEKGVTQAELDEAKSHVLGAFTLNLVSSSHIAELVHYYQRWGYPVDYPQKRNRLIESVTLEQVNAFAKKFLNPDGLTFIVVGKPDPSFSKASSR